MIKPLMEEVKGAIEILWKFRLYSDFGENILKSTRQVCRFIEREEQARQKQANITHFFKKIDYLIKQSFNTKQLLLFLFFSLWDSVFPLLC